jgi:hypothetical protein
MKKLSFILCLIIFISQVQNCKNCTECDPEEILTSDDNRIVFYGTGKHLYVIDGSLAFPEYFADGGYPIWLESKTKIGFHSPSNYNFYIINAEQRYPSCEVHLS